MSEEMILRFFGTYAGYLTELGGVYTNNIITEVLRRMAWSLILGMRRVCNSVEDVYRDVFDVLSIVKDGSVTGFADSLKGYVAGVLALTLVIVGYKVIAVEGYDLKRTVRNLAVTMLILAGAFSVISALSDITLLSVKSLEETQSAATADSIISDSVIDLVYRYEKGNLIPERDLSDREAAAFVWSGNRVIAPEELRLLDINEKVSEVLGENTEPFDHTCAAGKDGELTVMKFSDRTLAENGVSWIAQLMAGVPSYRLSYARYHVEFGTLILTVLALTAAYFFSVFKVFTIVFELIVTQTVLRFSAVTDLSAGERTKKLLVNIAGSFLSLFAMAVLYRLYAVVLTATLKMDIVNEHRILRTIAVLAYTFAIIDGPNIIKELLGIDVGLRSASGTFLSLWHAAGSAVRGIRGTAGIFAGSQGKETDPGDRDRAGEESQSFAEFMGLSSQSDKSSYAVFDEKDEKTVPGQQEASSPDEAENLAYASQDAGASPFGEEGFSSLTESMAENLPDNHPDNYPVSLPEDLPESGDFGLPFEVQGDLTETYGGPDGSSRSDMPEINGSPANRTEESGFNEEANLSSGRRREENENTQNERRNMNDETSVEKKSHGKDRP